MCLDRPTAAPEPRSRAIRPRLDPDRPRRDRRDRRVPARRGLLPPGQRIHLHGDAGPVRAPRAGRHRHRRRGARAQGAARPDRRAVVPGEPVEPDPNGRPRRPVRPDRRAQGRPAQPDRRRRQDRRDRLRGSGRDPGGDRPGRERAVQRQPAPDRDRLQQAQLAPPRRLRPARLSSRPPGRDQRSPDRLRGPRRPDHGTPEERPRRPRRPAQRRQDELRPEHRRARGSPRRAQRRRVQPGDEQGAARPAPAFERRQHRLAAACGAGSSRRWTSPGSRRR